MLLKTKKKWERIHCHSFVLLENVLFDAFGRRNVVYRIVNPIDVPQIRVGTLIMIIFSKSRIVIYNLEKHCYRSFTNYIKTE